MLNPKITRLASGLVNTGDQVDSALGLAIIVAISAAKTNAVIKTGATDMAALNAGFQTAFFSAAVICVIAAIIAALSIKSLKNNTFINRNGSSPISKFYKSNSKYHQNNIVILLNFVSSTKILKSNQNGKYEISVKTNINCVAKVTPFLNDAEGGCHWEVDTTNR